MDQYDALMQGITNFSHGAANVVSSIMDFQRIGAQVQYDKAKTQIARSSMQFREKLAQNTDYNSWISDANDNDGLIANLTQQADLLSQDPTQRGQVKQIQDEIRALQKSQAENAVGGAFGEYRRTLEAELQKSTSNPYAKKQVSALFEEMMLQDEGYVRETRMKKMGEAAVGGHFSYNETLFSTAKTMEDIDEIGDRQYQEGMRNLVDTGIMSKEGYDAGFMQQAAKAIDSTVTNNLTQIISTAGLNAGNAYIDQMTEMIFSGLGRATPYRVGENEKNAFKVKAQKIFDLVQKDKVRAYEQGLQTQLLGGNYGGMYQTLKTPEFQYWADPGTREHYLSILTSATKKEDDPKAEESFYWDQYYKAYNNGAPMTALRDLLYQGVSMGYVKDKDITAKLNDTYDDVIKTPEMAGVYEEIDAMSKPAKKGDKPLLTPAEAGQMKEQMVAYFQSHRKDIRPGELQEAYSAMRNDVGGVLKKKMAASLDSIVRGEGFGGGANVMDPFEDMSLIVQSGRLAGKIRTYSYTAGKTTNVVTTMTGPWVDTGHLDLLHKGHINLSKQDFPDPDAIIPRVLMDQDGIMQPGQLVFIMGKGKEERQFAYNVDGKDEILLEKKADGWKKVSKTPKDEAAVKTKAKETEQTAKEYGNAPPPPVPAGMDPAAWEQNWNDASPEDKKAYYKKSGMRLPSSSPAAPKGPAAGPAAQPTQKWSL